MWETHTIACQLCTELKDKSLKIRLDSLSDNHSDVATTYSNIGEVYRYKAIIKLEIINTNHYSSCWTHKERKISMWQLATTSWV